MTVTVYSETQRYTDEIRKDNPKRHVSVSGILYYLGVSKSGYYAWRSHTPSRTEDTQK
jgi:putative transposase